MTHQLISQLINGMFISPEAQVDRFRTWNQQYRLGFTEAEIDAIGEPPAWPKDDPLSVVLLHWSLDTVHRTADVSAQIAAAEQEGITTSQPIYFGELNIRLLPSIPFVPYRLQWEVVHLGAQVGAIGDRIRGPMSVHAQGIQAAGYFPEWVRAMDGKTVPYVMLSGYQITSCKWWDPDFGTPDTEFPLASTTEEMLEMLTAPAQDWFDLFYREPVDFVELLWEDGFGLAPEQCPSREWGQTIHMGFRKTLKYLALYDEWGDISFEGTAIPCTEAMIPLVAPEVLPPLIPEG